MSFLYALFVVVGFLAVVVLLEGVFLLWNDTRSPELRRIQQRLHMMATGERGFAMASLSKERVLSDLPELHKLLSQMPQLLRLDQLLQQAASHQNLAQLLGVCALAAGVGLLFSLVVGLPWYGLLVLTGALGGAPVARLVWLRARRLDKLVQQLPDALDLISRALRAGHAFSSALAMVGNEAQEPIASEFKTTSDEINFGISTKNALLNLANRVPVADMRYFVLAVVIQLETGGNLTELLGMLSTLIRERFKLFGKIKVLAAEGKLSAYIMTALPFFVAGALQLMNPGYMTILYTDPDGIRLVTGALVMMAVGVLWLWRITKIRV